MLRYRLDNDYDAAAAFIALHGHRRTWTVEDLKQCAVISVEALNGARVGVIWLHFVEDNLRLACHLTVAPAYRGNVFSVMNSRIVQDVRSLARLMGARYLVALYPTPKRAEAWRRVYSAAGIRTVRDGCRVTHDLDDYTHEHVPPGEATDPGPASSPGSDPHRAYH